MLLNACMQANSSVTQTPVVDFIMPVTPTPAATCSAISAEPTAMPGGNSLFPPVTDADFTFGPADAPVTLIEYCDFQSAGCANMAGTIARIMRERSDVRFVFRPLPLIGINDKAQTSVLAALAADEQGKFWEMYDLLFVKHNEWSGLNPSLFDAWILREAAAIGADANQLSAAMKAPETAARSQSMYEAAKEIGIPAVPLLLINGVLQQSYVLDYRNVNDTIGLIVLGQKQFTQCPPLNVDAGRQYIATIKTEKGDIAIQLFPDKAPYAVNSFVFLAQQGWFDGVMFHRVLPGFVAQAGDPSGTGRGGPGYYFNNEISNLKFDKPGVVGMANAGPDTNGSQFFITFAPAPNLDGAYTIFGQVLDGMDTVERLTPRDPSQAGELPVGDRILGIEIEVK